MRPAEDDSSTRMSTLADSSRHFLTPRHSPALVALAVIFAADLEGGRAASRAPASEGTATPVATLIPAPLVTLKSDVDSNSPAVWARVGRRDVLYVFTSFDGVLRRSSGSGVGLLGSTIDVTVTPWPPGRTWLEAVVVAEDGAWYGFYHNERDATSCGEGNGRAIPRLGALRSTNRGRTWKNLGTILSMPRRTYDCASPNTYFVGGVGDFSVMLDQDEEHLYIFYSQYVRDAESQGVAVARLRWADRDDPVGKVNVYVDEVWTPAETAGDEGQRWVYPIASPLFPTKGSWHDDGDWVDAFWGPSVHWNNEINQYVMLLNHARDTQWTQEGVYVSFSSRLDDPRSWSTPVKILDGGHWYPQVFGLDGVSGTDKSAGGIARFFMGGRSEHLIKFTR